MPLANEMTREEPVQQPTIIDGTLAKPPRAVRNIRAKRPQKGAETPPVTPPVSEWDDDAFGDRATLGDGQRMVVIRVMDGQVHWRTYHGTPAEAAADVLAAGTTIAAQVCASHAALEARLNAMVRAAMGSEG